MNGLVKDTYQLCLTILDAIAPGQGYVVVNIGKSQNRSFTYPGSYPQIPTSYGYTYDNVPQLLRENGILLAVSNHWYIGQRYGEKKHSQDNLTEKAREVGFFSSNEEAIYFYKYYVGRDPDKGPALPYHNAVLLDLRKMRHFVAKHYSYVPHFDSATGLFSFVGQTVTITGEKNVSAMALLVEKINSRVTKKKFYESGGDTNYDVLEKQKKLTQPHNTLDHRFDSIKQKVFESKVLQSALIMNREGGYGMFVDHSFFKQTP